MKKLRKEELGGIDSTSKTIKKWDTFFKEALPRLGYKQELIDNMYPYQHGVPMTDGTYMPVDATTGRVFFKMSAADKLCCLLSAISKQGYGSTNPAEYIKDILRILWEKDSKFFSACFPDKEPLEEGVGGTKEYWNNLIAKFILDSDIALSTNGQQLVAPQGEASLSDENKRRLFELSSNDAPLFDFQSGSFFIRLYNNTLADNYEYKFSRELIRSVFADTVPASAYNKLKNFDEVYLQDYLVVSLNPIDKFMCSTKQAFGSCMSIAKQCDVHGTSSVYAFGLPALFPTDSAFLVFMTAGKHKNMYWEEEEWVKDASDRDPEKAYKYIKMTCRALTYKGAPGLEKYNEFSSRVSRAIQDSAEYQKAMFQERLYIGRQYSANGEDFAWQSVISYLLGKAGVSTSYAYANELEKIDKEAYDSGFDARSYLNRGWMPQSKAPLAIDRFGFVRGIYYDNLRYSITSNSVIRKIFDGGNGYNYPLKEGTTIVDVQSHAPVAIKIGSSRQGSGGMAPAWPQSNLDMFKLMTGRQDYIAFNRYVKICVECGKLITEQGGIVKDINGDKYLCHSCLEKAGYVKCNSCGYCYKEDDEKAKAEHEIINLQKVLHPKDFHKFAPIEMCRTKIDTLRGSNKCICLHCGEIMDSWRISSYLQSILTIDDMNIPVGICDSCARNAVICSRCKKITFLDETADAVLLLPKKRIICPDCIKDIRLKQEQRELLQKVIDTRLTEANIHDPSAIDRANWTEEQRLAYTAYQAADVLATAKTKDVDRQIRSYQCSHEGATILDQVR